MNLAYLGFMSGALAVNIYMVCRKNYDIDFAWGMLTQSVILLFAYVGIEMLQKLGAQ